MPSSTRTTRTHRGQLLGGEVVDMVPSNVASFLSRFIWLLQLTKLLAALPQLSKIAMKCEIDMEDAI
ncbi:hypothetical protein EJB05_44092, partial [Eragrostis curvula]